MSMRQCHAPRVGADVVQDAIYRVPTAFDCHDSHAGGRNISVNELYENIVQLKLPAAIANTVIMTIFADIKTKPDSLTSQGLPGINTAKVVLSFD